MAPTDSPADSPRSHSHHSRQIAAPAHILAVVALGVPQHGQPGPVVVGQAAVLKGTCDHTAAHRLKSEHEHVWPRMHCAGPSADMAPTCMCGYVCRQRCPH